MFEIGDERGLGLIDLAATRDEINFEVFSGTAMAVPVGVIQLDETRTALDEATREETVARERRFIFFDAVKFERGFAFAAEIDELRRARLHATGHLVGGDAGVNLGIARGDGVLEIEIADGVDGLALARGGDALGVGEIEDRVAVAAERYALVRGREEARAPVDGATAGAARAGLEDDEAGEILRFAAEAVRDPRAHARAAELAGAGVHEQLRGRVIEQISGARFDECDVVDDAGRVREKIRDPRAALAVLGEGAARAEELRAVRAVHECEALAGDEGFGDRLAVERDEARLVVEQVELTRAAGHEKINDVFGARGEVRGLRGHGIGERAGRRRGRGAEATLVEHRGERDATEAHGATAKKMAT